MSDAPPQFEHFPLDAPEYREQVWQQQVELTTLAPLLEDPHAWIFENTGRAPEQLLGIHKDNVLIQFVYAAEAPSAGTMVIGGTLTRNLLNVYLPDSSDVAAADFQALVDAETQEVRAVLHDSLGYILHCPFQTFEHEQMLALLVQVIQAPGAYLDYLNGLLSLSPPDQNAPDDAPALRLQFPGDTPSGLRFLYQWNRPGGSGKPRFRETRCLRLTGTYHNGDSGQDNADEVVVAVDTIIYHPEMEPAPPPPPLPVTREEPAPPKTPAPAEETAPSSNAGDEQTT